MAGGLKAKAAPRAPLVSPPLADLCQKVVTRSEQPSLQDEAPSQRTLFMYYLENSYKINRAFKGVSVPRKAFGDTKKILNMFIYLNSFLGADGQFIVHDAMPSRYDGPDEIYRWLLRHFLETTDNGRLKLNSEGVQQIQKFNVKIREILSESMQEQMLSQPDFIRFLKEGIRFYDVYHEHFKDLFLNPFGAIVSFEQFLQLKEFDRRHRKEEWAKDGISTVEMADIFGFTYLPDRPALSEDVSDFTNRLGLIEKYTNGGQRKYYRPSQALKKVISTQWMIVGKAFPDVID